MKSKNLFLALTAGTVMMSGAAMADSIDNNRVARDTGGNVVRSIEHGTCVRTKWEAGTDVCAPVKQEVKKVVETPKPVLMERTVLNKNEQTVYFAFDSAELTDEAKSHLNNVASTLTSAKDVKHLEIVGTADRLGSNSYNQTLSEKRAQSVQSYLAEKGYANTRVAEVRAVGETAPTTNCDTDQNRTNEIACLGPDRRVDLEVQYLETERYSLNQ